MNSQQRSVQAESAEARLQTTLAALQRPPEPTRASPRTRPQDGCVHVALECSGAKVSVHLSTTQVARDSAPDRLALQDYYKRAAGALSRAAKRRKRDLESIGLPPVGCEMLHSLAVWDNIKARCRAVAERRAKPRGASRANRVSVKQRFRPDLHVQRGEQQAMRLRERVKAARAYRDAHIRKLRGVLFNDDAATLLVQPEDAPVVISKRQGARETTQWPMLGGAEDVATYEEINLGSRTRSSTL